MTILVTVGLVGLIVVGLFELVTEKPQEDLRAKTVAGKLGNVLMTLAIIGFIGFMLWLTTFSQI